MVVVEPRSGIDLYAEEVLEDPYSTYRALRDLGPAVFLETSGFWTIGRYDVVVDALTNWEAFSSAEGVGLNDEVNTLRKGTMISSDPPLHDQLRKVLSNELAPRALADLRGEIEAKAAALVDELAERGSFDAVGDLARVFPLSVVADLVGLPDQGRAELLEWAEAAFNAYGPPGERTSGAFPKLREMYEYLVTTAGREHLRPGSMGAAIYDAADAGVISAASCIPLMSAYTTAGMDTTVNALANAVMLFARHPDQWAAVRADRSLVRGAFNEVLRWDAPVQIMSRTTTRDVELDDTVIPENSRVIVLYGSANRDERKWDDPDGFDVTRKAADHLSFGWGVHICAGQALARLEAHALIDALADRIEAFEIGEPTRRVNNTLRGLHSLPTTVRPA